MITTPTNNLLLTPYEKTIKFTLLLDFHLLLNVRDNYILILKIISKFGLDRVRFKGDLVIASPDVVQVSLGSDAEFLLLASDGLWDYMNRYFTPFLTQNLMFFVELSMELPKINLDSKPLIKELKRGYIRAKE